MIATTSPNIAGVRNEEGIKCLFYYVEAESGKIMKKVC